MLSKRALAKTLPDPRRCTEKNPVEALDRVTKQFLSFNFGYRDGNQLLSYRHGGYPRPKGDLLISDVWTGNTMTQGPYGQTLSHLIRQIGGGKPDYSTLWVGWTKGPLPRKEFAELCGAAVAAITKTELPPVEEDSWTGLAQRAANRGSIEAYFDPPVGGRVMLTGNGNGTFNAFQVGQGRNADDYPDLRSALTAISRGKARIDPRTTGVHRAKNIWVSKAKLIELLAQAVVNPDA